jgi:hypothetical protein
VRTRNGHRNLFERWAGRPSVRVDFRSAAHTAAMFIKEIIIDGFKSYANRTVIPGWDPSFNAITGANGTGKSNILDAICFVLGITNLAQVRVHNLQEVRARACAAGLRAQACLRCSCVRARGAAGVQAGPIARHQGHGHHSLRQPRREEQPRGL